MKKTEYLARIFKSLSYRPSTDQDTIGTIVIPSQYLYQTGWTCQIQGEKSIYHEKLGSELGIGDKGRWREG